MLSLTSRWLSWLVDAGCTRYVLLFFLVACAALGLWIGWGTWLGATIAAHTMLNLAWFAYLAGIWLRLETALGTPLASARWRLRVGLAGALAQPWMQVVSVWWQPEAGWSATAMECIGTLPLVAWGLPAYTLARIVGESAPRSRFSSEIWVLTVMFIAATPGCFWIRPRVDRVIRAHHAIRTSPDATG